MDERSPEQKPSKKTGFDAFFAKVYRPGPLIAIFIVAFVALVSLGVSLLTEKTPPPEVIQAGPAASPEPATPREYEEATSELEDFVKQADLAIIETLRDLGLPMADLDLVDVELRRFEGHDYHYQVLQFPKVDNRGQFLVTLRKRLFERLPDAALFDNGDDEALVQINGRITHRLLLESRPRIIARPEAKGPKLAIVIDDVGENQALLKGLIALDLPLTFAVWPNASFTRKAVELISQKQRDILVHFPMEPRGYPKVDPGDDALFVSMSDAELLDRIRSNLKAIPEAIGVNNHMGSRFTTHEPGMAVALAEFKRHGLFFLDSMTSPRSVGESVARSTAISFYKRDTFLDNVKDVNAIVLQLRKAERVARHNGSAIAIGHPHKATLEALRAWQKTRDPSVSMISLSKLPPKQ
ncbi:MAG: divergent polysaccharide deacetylase family protein [Desulfovibrionaceae bacterium]|nr:divergent polysaccharide deacetylase family protein [Desulfovibrionaceae bacterium]